MIPCYVCGKDIGGGWSIGFPPAPDSEKMGLCREHDLSSHRERVQRAWQELIYKRLEANTQNTALRAGDIPQLLSIYFTGGGAVSLPCSSISTIDGKTLKATTPGGEHIYFPLNQVRNYALSPLDLGAASPRRAKAEESRPEPETLEADETDALPVSEPKAELPPAPEEAPEETPPEETPEEAEPKPEDAAANNENGGA